MSNHAIHGKKTKRLYLSPEDKKMGLLPIVAGSILAVELLNLPLLRTRSSRLRRSFGGQAAG